MDLRQFRLDEPALGTFSEERDEYERDYARLIQSPAFRRLQGKSQVFGAGSGDYYRTRLTHSLEVSQIAREVARRLGKQYPFLSKKEHPGLILDPAVVERISNREEVSRLLDELQGEEADVVRLYHLEGKSYHEISQQTGMAENSIGPTLTRARAKMRRHGQGLDTAAT